MEGGFAPGDPVTPLNLKDPLAALGSNRIGLDLPWSLLAQRSCWPGLPSEFETNFVNALGRCAVSLAGFWGSGHVSSWHKSDIPLAGMNVVLEGRADIN